jgi:hypothetical protein
MNVHNDDWNGRPSLATADLLDQVNEKIQENRSHIFLHLKRILVAKRFSSDDEVKTAAQHWVKTLMVDFDGIQKFVPWYDRCLNLGGHYVKK